MLSRIRIQIRFNSIYEAMLAQGLTIKELDAVASLCTFPLLFYLELANQLL